MYQFLKPKHFFILFFTASSGALTVQASAPNLPESAISYGEALEKAFQNDPNLKGYEARFESVAGTVEQAELRPNPVVGLEVENILGSGPFSGFQGADVTLGVSQLIETAGKRKKRGELARTKKELLEWERELRQSELEAELRTAFVKVLLAQKTVALREDQVELTKQSRAETARLVEAARNLEVDLSRAKLSVRQQQFALDQACRDLESAKAQLAAFWSDSPETDYEVTGLVELEARVPEMAELAALLPDTAYLGQYQSQLLHREAVLDLEIAKAKPDVEIFGGGRYFNEGRGESAFVFGVQVPWPLFDKNQGNIRSARADLRSVGYEKAATRRKLFQELTNSYQALKAAHEEASTLQSELLPSAEKTLEESRKAYQQGRFTLLAVLESRATLFEIRESYLHALGRYALAQARIEALTRSSSK